MKYSYILIALFIILANLLVGFVYPAYLWWHFVASSCVIVIGTIMIGVVDAMDLKDGFKVSLFSLIPFFTIIEFVLAVLSSTKLEGNWLLLVILFMLLMQIILIICCYVVSLNSKNK